jgi:hypothetical protein
MTIGHSLRLVNPKGLVKAIPKRQRHLKFKSCIVLLRAIFGSRWEMPKLAGFSTIQTRLTFANDPDYAKRDERECDRVRLLRGQAITNFRRIAVTQEI